MQHRRSLSVLVGVGSAAFLALPIALTSYIGAQRSAIEFPAFHSAVHSVEHSATPISDQKVKAVRTFKIQQA